jgi:hypothetical protein
MTQPFQPSRRMIAEIFYVQILPDPPVPIRDPAPLDPVFSDLFAAP